MTRRSRAALGVALAVAALAAGCGDSGGATASPADDFVGTWHYNDNDVMSVLQCPGTDALNKLPQPNKIFARGASAPLVDLSESPLLSGIFCDFGFDVGGGVATVQPGQTCVLTALDSFTVDQPMGSSPLWTFTLNSATAAEEIVQATAHFLVSGTPEACSWNMVAHLTRISKD